MEQDIKQINKEDEGSDNNFTNIGATAIQSTISDLEDRWSDEIDQIYALFPEDPSLNDSALTDLSYDCKAVEQEMAAIASPPTTVNSEPTEHDIQFRLPMERRS